MIKVSLLRHYTQQVQKVSFPLINKDHPYALIYYPENGNFLTDYSKLGLRYLDFRHVVIPTTLFPKTKISNPIRSEFRKLKMASYASTMVYPSKVNIILDMSFYLKKVDEIYKPANYRQRAGILLKNTTIQMLNLIPGNYKKILLYSIDQTKEIKSFYDRKIFPFLKMMRDEEDLPFDDLLFCRMTDTKTLYRLLVKDKEYNLQRIFVYMKNIKYFDTKEELEEDSEKASEKVLSTIKDKNLVSKQNEDKLKDIIKTYLSVDQKQLNSVLNLKISEKQGEKTSSQPLAKKPEKNEKEELSRIAIASVLYRISGDINKSRNTAKSVDSKKIDSAIKVMGREYVDELLPFEKPLNMSLDEVIKQINIGEMTDNKYPGHLFRKRNLDFEINLQKDMTNAFKVLETKDIKINLQSLEIKDAEKKLGELSGSDFSILNATMEDEFGNIHKINMEIPKIKEDGTFRLYGRRKCLLNQIILCPISFPKRYMGKFESSYSIFHIWSRKLRGGNYLEMYIGSYTIPLFVLLSYYFGMENTIKLYDLKYEIREKMKKTEIGFKIDDDNFFVFENIDSDLKQELCRSISRLDLTHFKIQKEFGTKEFFNDLIIKMTGRVSSTYQIKMTFDNIVDPIAKQILINQQLPFELDRIIKYMAEKVVAGYLQDRNDISNQRIRNSEILVHLAQKQILAAYSTYREQILSGNKSAVLEIKPNKVLKDFINSEVLMDMEFSNPAEEMSVMTRVTPVGKYIGGIPTTEAFQLDARNVHPSYFGNIDPLDTPEGANIGIVQQLSIDAYITSSRGLIHTKPISNDEKSGVLGTSTALIPFVENNDGVRIMMSANQSRQALPLENPEPPYVQSGYETILTNVLSDNFIKRSPCNGKIIEITDTYISVKCADGKIEQIDITPRTLRSGTGKNTLSIFIPTVKQNIAVKKGQIIAEGSSIKNGIISQGRNILVGIMPYKGFNYEDGVVINEKLVSDKKLTSLHLIEEEIEIDNSDRISFFMDKINTVTNKGDHLLRKSIGEIEKMIGFDVDEESEEFISGQYIKKSGGGKIVNIEVFSNLENEDNFQSLKTIINKTNQKYKKPKNEKYTIKGKPIKGALIKYKIQQNLDISFGDKLCNRYGNKGIISLIEKDNLMPRTPWGESLDIVMNPLGILNRMNIGQLYEMYCGLIGKELYYRIMKLGPKKNEIANLLRSTIGVLDSTTGKKSSELLIQKILKMPENMFKEFYSQIYESKVFPIIIPPFKSPNYKLIQTVLKTLNLKPSYKLYLPEYNTHTSFNVAVGYMYIQKLEHLGDLKIHSRGTGPVTGKYLQPTQGKRRAGGQRVGESDSFAQIAYGSLYTLQELFGPLSDDQRTKNEIISEIITNGETEYRTPSTNPTRDLLQSYFISLMLEGE